MTRRWLAIAIVVGAACTVAGGWPAHAERSTTTGTGEESWYLTATAGPVAPPAAAGVNPYPAGTLHVGVTAGREESRSYITLDLRGIDPDEVVGGTLVLPIAADGGSVLVEAARFGVCRASVPDEPVRGSIAPPPEAECTIGAPARLTDASDAFEVDLEPLAGFLDQGLALVPLIAAQEDTWHVALNAKDNSAAGAKAITATLLLRDEAALAAPVLAPPPLDADSFGAALHPESAPVAAPDVGLFTANAPATPVIATPNSEREGVAAGAAPIAVAAGDGFEYSIVFALPLVLLLAVPYFGYALTGPINAADHRRRDRRPLNNS